MKKFISGNWYKLLLGSSAFMFSVAFLIFALKGNQVYAGNVPLKLNTNPPGPVYIVESNGKIFEVRPGVSGGYSIDFIDAVK